MSLRSELCHAVNAYRAEQFKYRALTNEYRDQLLSEFARHEHEIFEFGAMYHIISNGSTFTIDEAEIDRDVDLTIKLLIDSYEEGLARDGF